MKTFTNQMGFTLIEIMMVTAILAIIAAIAIPTLQDYVLRTKLMTIYKETHSFRIPYQLMMDQGAGVRNFTPDGLNMYEQTRYCQYSVTAPVDNGDTIDAIRCDIQNISMFHGQHLSLNRNSDGEWVCTTTAGIPRRYVPPVCL